MNGTPGDAFTMEKYREIRQYAIEHCAFYQDYRADDRFPVMNKQDFIRNADLIRSDEVFAEPLHTTSTSGSTGTPFTVYQDREKRCRTIADLKVYGEYADYPSHEKMLQLRAYGGKTLDREVDRRENIWRYDITLLNPDTMRDLVQFILDWQPRIVFGYVSTLEMICKYVLESGRKYDFKVRSVLVGAEMLSDEAADMIRQVFNCPVYDRYSNMEMGIYAQREHGATPFIVNKASYYLEVLRPDCDEPVGEHEIGRIVFTDLFNHAFPMIRYDTGDLGSYCLVNGEKQLEKVYGRRVDTIFDVHGQIVDPHIISHGMWGVTGIAQWQFIQQARGQYVIRINASGDVDEQDLLSRMKHYLGEEACIALEYVQDIPVLGSQKRKYILNEMKG
ncbi:MAG: phenylacetate--CoA ligase family protein [Clostridiales bacterium]|nr:phenylacetate--CoA ligase family protein [Clostridiales bacterium]